MTSIAEVLTLLRSRIFHKTTRSTRIFIFLLSYYMYFDFLRYSSGEWGGEEALQSAVLISYYSVASLGKYIVVPTITTNAANLSSLNLLYPPFFFFFSIISSPFSLYWFSLVLS